MLFGRVWEDNELYAGQGHRRNMLNSKFNCVGIGHVYYNGFHYWVENFAYRDKVNTTPVSADNTETTLTIPVATSKISNFNITFDKDEYSLKTGESTSISVSDPTISVFGHWGSRFVFVTDTPDLTIADSTVATLSGTITGISSVLVSLQMVQVYCFTPVLVQVGGVVIFPSSQ